MRSLASFLLLVICLSVAPLLAGESNVTCDKFAKEPEFTWNPENQYVTPRLNRFYSLEDKIRAAYDGRNDSEVKKLTGEYLALASVYRCNWNYGNAVHDANRYLGLVSLRNGNVDEAAEFLLLSGKSTGSPQLDTFGPDLDLANQLLRMGKVGPVKEYLRGIKRFWRMDNGQVDQWLSAIDRGEKPELNRFSAMKPSPWMIALDWFVTAWPGMAVLGFMYAGRRRLSRKALFLIAGIVSGYASLLLVSLGMVTLITRLATSSESTGHFVVISMVYLPIILALAMPALVVFMVFRCFLSKQ